MKPRNVVRRDDGSFVFVDFGTVSELMARRGASTVVGTIGYMAPEQLQGRAMPASDVYAVGATALAALTGADPDTLPHQGLKIDVRRALAGRASEAMIATLERMLEPDPDQRATSVAGALEWRTPQVSTAAAPGASPSTALAPVRPMGNASEDTAVKSIRNLLWVLWGLSWVMVPLLVRRLELSKDTIPLVMFGALASVLVVTWQKGAVIRAMLRAVIGAPREVTSPAPEPVRIAPADTRPHAQQRIDVGQAGNVRVHSGELAPEELTGATERPARKARRAR